MKSVRILGLMLLAAVLCTAPALAQKRPAKKPVKARTTAAIPPLDVRTAREKVDIQLFNVNDFLNKLGPIAVSLETAIADQKAGKLRTETSQAVDGAREKLVVSIRGLREALTPLESEFRT